MLTQKVISISELKARLSECLRQVKHGEQWTVTERGRSIAVLAPLPQPPESLQALAAEGAVRLGSGTIPPQFWDLPHAKDTEGSVRSAVLEERAQGW